MSHPTHATETIIEAVGNPTLQVLGAILFAIAVLHTFMVKRFEHMAHRHPEGSKMENFLHLLGETEAVFAMWATVLLVNIAGTLGMEGMIKYMETRNYTEPMFVFVIMTLAATRPILELVTKMFTKVAGVVPLVNKNVAFFCVTLILGPLLGSFITEPAAMTVTALVLLERYFQQPISTKLRYAITGLLFVSVSIGGTLTNYAAPPVLMVAGEWGWDMGFMLSNFGYKAVLSISVTTVLTALVFYKQLSAVQAPAPKKHEFAQIPVWVTVVHLMAISGVVYFSHNTSIFMWIFGLFLAFFAVTKEYQDELKLMPALMVGVFLAGLVTIGGMQQWWLQPLLDGMPDFPLFTGATGLTAITDNAALTYLGTLVEGLSDGSKIALVSGAVVGGGLTVIANAPNPAGFGILKPTFGEDGISPGGLLLGALAPTVIAFLAFWFPPGSVAKFLVEGGLPRLSRHLPRSMFFKHGE